MVSADHEKIIEGKNVFTVQTYVYDLTQTISNPCEGMLQQLTCVVPISNLSAVKHTRVLDARFLALQSHHEKPKGNTKAAELAQILDKLLLNQAVTTTTAKKVES